MRSKVRKRDIKCNCTDENHLGAIKNRAARAGRKCFVGHCFLNDVDEHSIFYRHQYLNVQKDTASLSTSLQKARENGKRGKMAPHAT